MLSVDEALARILASARPTEAEEVPIGAALGRVLAEPRVRAPADVPPFANSAMDGWALRAADTPGELQVVGESAAGAASLPTVQPGTAVRITTGAPLPPGADAVVPLERAQERGASLRIGSPVTRGDHVREAGHDTRAGDELCLPDPLTPAALAVLASLGLARLAVRRRPRVAILSTGDELVPPGSSLRPGQIFDANSAALTAAVDEAGGEPLSVAAAADEPGNVELRLREGAAGADLLVVSGGVSVGRHDHVRAAIERLGRLDLWRVAMQPGKPLAFGDVAGTPVIGLPGNPVSALVTFELFVRPWIRAAQGSDGDGRLRVVARLEEPIRKDPERRAYLRVRIQRQDAELVARAAGGQSSSQLRPLADADALLVVPEGEPMAEVGRGYEAILLR